MAVGAVGAVIVVIAILLAVTLPGGGKGKAVTKGNVTGTFALPASLVASVENVPVKKLVAAAEACAANAGCFAKPTGASPPEKLAAGAPALKAGGHPELLYIGAEYCPFCAAERWPMLMALSKFGKFGTIRGTTSSATDVNASTPTFSFYKVSYKSKYLSFVPVEETTNNYATLQNPTPAQQAIITTYDGPPYTAAANKGSIPFLYIGGKYVSIGTSYDASAIAGMPIDSAAPLMTSGTNATSKHAMAVAGFLLGDICSLTRNQPASVCSQVPANLRGITTSSSVGKGSKVTSTNRAPAKSGKTVKTK
jgi:hypothetical protein